MPQIQLGDLRSKAPLVLKVRVRELPVRAIRLNATVPDQIVGWAAGGGTRGTAGAGCASRAASTAGTKVIAKSFRRSGGRSRCMHGARRHILPCHDGRAELQPEGAAH